MNKKLHQIAKQCSYEMAVFSIRYKLEPFNYYIEFYNLNKFKLALLVSIDKVKRFFKGL